LIGWAAACVAAACSYGPEASEDALKASDIVQLRWIAKGADRVAVLTQLPPACEVSGEMEQRRLGRIAFESPALLGGAAARMGLSCSSCHLNGRGSPDFFLDGLSDRAGTADVTSSVLSKVRGDGNFNPKPIPDIGLRDGNQLKDRLGPEFAAKVHGLIEEEFDGQAAPKPVFDAVIAYLDGLDPRACGTSPAPLSPLRDIDAVEAAYEAGRSGQDGATRIFYLRAARGRLERIHERYAGPGQAAIRGELVQLSRSMETVSEAIRAGTEIPAIEPGWPALRARLQGEAARSLYDPEVLRTALAREEAAMRTTSP
jgi:hypothetical protein